MAGYDRMTPEGKKFYAELEKLKNKKVRIGFQSGTDTVDGVDIVDIAVYNETGTENIPARPFMRQCFDENEDTITKFCQIQAKKITKGETAENVLRSVGAMQKGLIQDFVTKSPSWAVPNAPSTIAKKKSATPLIDTGRLNQAVSFVIKEE